MAPACVDVDEDVFFRKVACWEVQTFLLHGTTDPGGLLPVEIVGLM